MGAKAIELGSWDKHESVHKLPLYLSPNKKTVHTSSFLTVPSNIASAEEAAMAMQRLSSTVALGPFRTFQKERVAVMVMATAISETEQPAIEMISRAFLWC